VAQEADQLSQLSQAFSSAVISSRLGAPSFNGIGSFGFYSSQMSANNDAILLIRKLATACQISANHSGPFEHLAVNSMNEMR
jgi:hypothetical protein